MPHFDKLVTPPIATLLMAQNLYLPSVVSIVIIVLCFILSRKVADSEQALKTTSNETHQSSESLLNDNNRLNTRSLDYAPLPDDPADPRGDVPADPTDSTTQDISVTEASVSRALHRFRKIIAHLHREPVLSFCYLAFYLKSVAMASEAFVFQYFSEKFGWPLQETTILRFALSFGAVVATLVIGPLVSSRLALRGVPTPTIDLGIVCISLLALTICFTIAWRADSSTIFILCTRL